MPGSCGCQKASIKPELLPLLAERGQRPEWDRYLTAVYGNDVQYPVALDSFRWFYRCSCHLIDQNCNQSTYLLDFVPTSWRADCLDEAAPITTTVMPKVWFSSRNTLPCTNAFREAFVGVHIAAHVRRNPSWRSWPNPEFRLAPFGIWLYPRPIPNCLQNDTWVEVIRRREVYEGSNPFTWFYHAPGSGIWLNTGRTVCLADQQRDSYWMGAWAERSYVANSTSLRQHGFITGIGTVDARLSTRRGRLSHVVVEADTLQRNGPFGNMLEIVDVRAEAAQRCGTGGCTCSGHLRAGWRASRPCFCDNKRDVLNCGRDDTRRGP